MTPLPPVQPQSCNYATHQYWLLLLLLTAYLSLFFSAPTLWQSSGSSSVGRQARLPGRTYVDGRKEGGKEGGFISACCMNKRDGIAEGKNALMPWHGKKESKKLHQRNYQFAAT